MANEVKILISAVDKASATLNKVQNELKQTGETGQKGFLGMGKAALGAVGGIAAVGAAVFAASKFIKGSIEDWANYNEEIRKLSIATGTAPEDLSRLTQAADDVGVSMAAMETAMRLASKNGITPSIENLAKLSDELLAIQDPAERSAEMAKKFGRGWAEIAPFILSGGDAIRAGTAAIEDNLVATNKSITEARKYKAAVDNLTDTWTGLRNQAGAIVLPIITEGLEDAARGIGIISRSIELSNTADAALKKHVITYDEYVIVMRQVREGAISDAEAIELLKKKIQDSIDPLTKMEMQGRKTNVQIEEMGKKAEMTAEEIAEMSMNIDKSAVYAGNLADKAGAAARQVEKLGDTAKEMKVIEIGLDFQFPDIGDQIENFFDKDKWAAAGGEALEAAFGKVNEAVQNNQITRTQAGIVFKELYLENARIQMALGNWDLEAAAQNIRDTLGVSLAEALTLVTQIRSRASFDIDSYLTVHVNYETGTAPGGGGKKNVELDLLPDNKPGRAAGGSVSANQVYMVGERGPEIFIPGAAGSIVPNNQIGGGNNITVNVYPTPGQSETAIANAVIRKINQSMRAASRSGVGYTG